MTIVSIRASHGAGKSSVVRGVMNQYKTEPQVASGAKRPWGYLTFAPQDNTIFTAGPYVSACGGCDAIVPYAKILPLLQEYEPHGHVLFEGALVSSSVGSVGAAMNTMGDPVFAFLDTPLELCIERVRLRREARGVTTPLDPKNIIFKYNSVLRTKDQLARLGYRIRIVDIDHRAPVKGVLKLFGVNLRKEPLYAPL